MDSGMSRLRRDLEQVQREAERAVSLETQRARFLAWAGDGPTRSRRSRLIPAITLAAAAAIALVALGWGRHPVMRFDVAGVTGRQGDVIAAPAQESVPVAFSDGTRMVLARQGRARILDTTSSGARVVLEQGGLSANVVHRDRGTRWGVEAGPFRVDVVGTRFDVDWDPLQQRFTLALHEGRLLINGPTLTGERLLTAGERIQVNLGPPDSSPRRHEPLAPPGLEPGAPAAPSIAPRSSPRQASDRNGSAPEWRTLATRAHYHEAWAAISRRGFAAVAERATASDLVLLGDVARFSNRPVEATAALLSLRKRFPDDPEARDAAFLLGRVAADQRASHADAVHWLSIYLKEQPGGTFAGEAAGRLIEAHAKGGARAEAQAAATRYLTQYPEGPYAARARRVLESP